MPPAAAFLSSADADQLGLDLKNKFGAVARPPNPEPAKFNMGDGIIQLTQDALLPSDPTATGGISLTGDQVFANLQSANGLGLNGQKINDFTQMVAASAAKAGHMKLACDLFSDQQIDQASEVTIMPSILKVQVGPHKFTMLSPGASSNEDAVLMVSKCTLTSV